MPQGPGLARNAAEMGGKSVRCCWASDEPLDPRLRRTGAADRLEPASLAALRRGGSCRVAIQCCRNGRRGASLPPGGDAKVARWDISTLLNSACPLLHSSWSQT